MEWHKFSTMEVARSIIPYKADLIRLNTNSLIEFMYRNKRLFPDPESRTGLALALLTDSSPVRLTSFLLIKHDLASLLNERYLKKFSDPKAREMAIKAELALFDSDFMPSDDVKTTNELLDQL